MLIKLNRYTNGKSCKLKIDIMLEQQDNSDSDDSVKNFSGTSDLSSTGTAKRCIKALAYKSFAIQQKRYCSNCCQIITPVLCVMFTVVIRMITERFVSDQIFSLSYAIPFDLPQTTKLLSASSTINNLTAHISCREAYLYQFDIPEQSSQIERFFGRMMKRKCREKDFKGSTPQFRHKASVNKEIMDILAIADLQPFQRGQDLKVDIPDGLLKIHNLTRYRLNITFAVNDFRLPEYHKNNGVTKVTLPKKNGEEAQITGFLSVAEGAMTIEQKISRSFLQSIDQKEIIFGNRVYMPFNGADVAITDKIINIMGASLYSLGLALLLPLFLYTVVSEKQDRMIEIMKMNGLNVKYYWLNFFTFNYFLSVLAFGSFFFFGRYMADLTFFRETSWTVLWAVLLSWGVAQISMTMLVQIFLSDAKSATIVGYILSTFSTIAGQPITIAIYPFPTPLPWTLMLYPPMTLSRAIGMISIACSNDSCYRSIFDIDYELFRCIAVMFGWFFVFLAAIWLNDIVQQDFGVAHRPWIIEILHKKLCRSICCMCSDQSKHGQMISEVEMDSSLSMDENLPEIKESNIDQSVHKEAESISLMSIEELPLIAKNLSKKYETFSSSDHDYVALKPLSICLKEREILGLLGPNGAGKTTLISVLTGMYPKTSGNAWIKGFNVGQAGTNRHIGVCPQFDLLWKELSVYQHLKFYALLKGVTSEFIQGAIDRFISDFDLEQWRNTPSQHLSGGMKRRLSIANGLIGNPSVVFLDQPSSGLDPGHRRQLWNILLKCKRKTSILLTTHLMEEAQVLCDRVGIIDKGSLKCIGKIHDLKEKFGRGYRLTINFNKMKEENLKRGENSPVKENPLVKKVLQKYGATIINQLTSRIVFKIQKSHLFDCIRMLKEESTISWMVGQPSLYDVFIDFVK